jgi:hypothetical protein
VHAELPYLVARGRYYASSRCPADYDWLAFEGRVVALLDGRVKRVHVDVKD